MGSISNSNPTPWFIVLLGSWHLSSDLVWASECCVVKEKLQVHGRVSVTTLYLEKKYLLPMRAAPNHSILIVLTLWKHIRKLLNWFNANYIYFSRDLDCSGVEQGWERRLVFTTREIQSAKLKLPSFWAVWSEQNLCMFIWLVMICVTVSNGWPWPY